MQRLITSRRAFVSLAALLFLLTASFSTTAFSTIAYAAVQATPYTALSGSFTPASAGTRVLGHHSSSASLTISVVLQPSNAAQLDSLLANLYDPNSSEFHHWLATGAFDARFAPSAAASAQVSSFLSKAGLQVTTSPSPFILRAQGSVSQIEAAFKTRIQDYQTADGQLYFQNASAVQVPASLSNVVLNVAGLYNTMRVHPHYITTRNAAQKAGRSVPSYGAGPGGSGLTPSQSSSLYGANKLYSLGSRGQGKGATLAVFELSGYTPSDVTTYEHQFFGASENVPLVDINVDGGPLTPVCPKGDKCNPANDYSGDIEVVADIETQIAIAPRIDSVLVYNAPNDFQGITVVDEYLKIAHDNLADSISSSWGLCEQDAGLAAVQAEAVAFKQMAAQGQSMFSASGDTGAYGCLRGSGSTKLAVGDPASQPYVTGVGGTSFGTFDPGMNQHPNYPAGFETVWNVLNGCSGTPNCIQRCVNNGASGGGVSVFWAKPSYQYGPGVISTYSQKGAYCGQAADQYCREEPDVSANADEYTPYAEYCTGNAKTNSACGSFSATLKPAGWFGIGGTSLSSPLWSAAIALAVSSHYGERFGNANHQLYNLFRSDKAYSTFYHDITGKYQTENNNGFYPVTPNYDMATGIGTPRITGIAEHSY
jgi:kumamolisin